jgi:hypothetical protein
VPSKSDTSATPGVSDDAIRDRAYFLWEADGRPDGRGDHYWGLALAELTAAAAPKAKKPSAPPKSASKTAKKAEAAKPAKAAKKAEAAKPAKKAATKPRAAAVAAKKPK